MGLLRFWCAEIWFPEGLYALPLLTMELGPQNHNRDGLLVPNSIMVVYMDPLGYTCFIMRPKEGYGKLFKLLWYPQTPDRTLWV